MNSIKLAILWFQIYALEIHINGCDECLYCVHHQPTINKILDARITAKRELHRLRGVQRELRMSHNKWGLA